MVGYASRLGMGGLFLNRGANLAFSWAYSGSFSGRSRMALTGQTWRQAPQSMQMLGSMTMNAWLLCSPG